MLLINYKTTFKILSVKSGKKQKEKSKNLLGKSVANSEKVYQRNVQKFKAHHIIYTKEMKNESKKSIILRDFPNTNSISC